MEKWHQYINSYFTQYAYCLLPNHFHVLCKAKPVSESIKQSILQENTKKGNAYLKGEVAINVFYESQFRSFFNSYTNAINRQEENRYDSLFKAKFRRTQIVDIEQFKYYVQYIHHNPIHHKIANDYLIWSYSSYLAYHNDIAEKHLSKKQVLNLFSTSTDKTGLQGFIDSHERFKDNFPK